MPKASEPFVSVVTPFYNTADYLAECIESVLGQTYRNFEYLLVNNCSTDGSLEIAQGYARKDPRIRLHTNASFCTQVANYNGALELISPESHYTKIVQADDKAFPTCLAEMVRVGESSPRVGVVSSFGMRGTKVVMDGFPFDEEIVSGRALCREQLLRQARFFASPTTVLYRSEIVRNKKPFYDERLLHEDTENCYQVLLDWDFGFVKQILTFLRTDNDSILSGIKAIDPRWPLLDQLVVTRRFGPQVLNAEEFRECWGRIEREYLRHVGNCYFLVRNPRFWARHRAGTETIAYQPSRFILSLYGMRSLAGLVMHPRQLAGLCNKILLKFKQRAGLAVCD